VSSLSKRYGRDIMKTYFLDYPITYTGQELKPHWILKTTKITGNALVAFHGPCQVETHSLVDLQDQLNSQTIYSEAMVHFIGEWFQSDLKTMILRQRLMVATLGEIIVEKTGLVSSRKGNDLYIDNKKLNVSVATLSLTSGLIHLGINISSKNTPVPTVGLEDIKLCQFELTNLLLERVKIEEEEIEISCVKVRALY
jgi:uncharacterized protein